MPPKKAYESYESDSEGDNQPQSKGKKQKLDKTCDDYRNRRERNNVAVRKSREASRLKAKDTMDKVSKLRDENKALEQKVTILNKELGVLRDLFLSQASAVATDDHGSASNNNNNSNSAQDDVTVTKVDATVKSIDLEPEYLAQDHKYFVNADHSSS